ncbi:MAG TPA: hypothetical protein VND83_00995 [Acidimicrobiales bacterium]|nr:hypothetical protein [Acidimicrobiales bacterium]
MSIAADSDVRSIKRSSLSRRKVQRWLVHVGLIATVITSLVLEPVMVIHVAFGVAFAVLVGIHLAQRRLVSKRLSLRLLRFRQMWLPAGRLALADGFLFIISIAMLLSGFWDLWAPHHTKFRWHAITGVVLTFYLGVHTVRRWRRLRFSEIR